MKYFIWALLIYVAWRWYTGSRQVQSDQSPADARQAGQSPDSPETMVQCARCGIHLPASEALIETSGAVFCSEEHRAA